jgi:hypothetical protein
MRKICSFAGAAAGLALLFSQPLAGTAATLPKLGLPAGSTLSVTTPVAHLPAVTTRQVTVPGVTAPSATVPSVTVLSVTVPSVTVLSVTIPSVTIPSVTIPSVTTPHVTTPVGPAPTVSTPSVTTPSATIPSATTPKVPTPVVKAPSTTNPPSLPGSPSHSTTSGVTSAGPDPSGASSAATPSPASAGRSNTPANAGASPSDTTRTHSTSPASPLNERRPDPGPAADRRSRQARENRHLRNVVERYRGCVSSLDSRSQRLLSLRAGLRGAPRGAGPVARALPVSAGRERQLERKSLLALQAAAGRGCGGSPTLRTATATATAPPGVTGSGATPVSSGSSSAASTGSASSRTSPRQHASADGGRSARPVLIARTAIRTAEQAWAGPGAGPGKEIVLLGVLVLAVSLRWLRRHHLPAATSPDPRGRP